MFPHYMSENTDIFAVMSFKKIILVSLATKKLRDTNIN